jgi:hypothetical protein
MYELADINTKLKIRKCEWGKILCCPLSTDTKKVQNNPSIHWSHGQIISYRRSDISSTILQWKSQQYKFKIFLFNRITLLQIQQLEQSQQQQLEQSQQQQLEQSQPQQLEQSQPQQHETNTTTQNYLIPDCSIYQKHLLL